MTIPKPYVVDLSTGDVRGGPPADIVQHCNGATGYKMITHPYDPDGCEHCAEIRALDEEDREVCPATGIVLGDIATVDARWVCCGGLFPNHGAC